METLTYLHLKYIWLTSYEKETTSMSLVTVPNIIKLIVMIKKYNIFSMIINEKAIGLDVSISRKMMTITIFSKYL